jgi:hypothetical protein
MTRSGPVREFLRSRRGLAILVGWLAFAAYVGIVVDDHAGGFDAVRRGGKPFYNDFTPFYAASLQVADLPAETLYDVRQRYWAMVAAIEAAYGPGLTPRQSHAAGYPPWMHPPSFVPFIAPLAALPYLPALVFWLLATAIPYLAAMRAIIPDRAAALAFAVACPPVFFNLVFGQSGFLTGGFIGLGLALLEARPVAAGICIGLASCKPHLGILIPLALLLGRRRRAFAAAAVTVVALALVSLVAYGPAAWAAFFVSLERDFRGFGEQAYNFLPMANPLGMLMLAGAAPAIAWAGQAVAMAAALAAVAWAWTGVRPAGEAGLQAAVLCCATVLFVPMVYLYDLVLIAPAMAWLWLDMRARGARRWEAPALAVCAALMLPVREIALATGFQPMPVLVAGLLALAVRRLASARATIPLSQSDASL